MSKATSRRTAPPAKASRTAPGTGRRPPAGSRHDPARRRWLIAVVAVAVVAAAAVGIYAASRPSETGAGATGADVTGAPYVGGDLHVMAAIEDRLYVGGHGGAAVSTDGGQAWAALESLRGADAMGWAQTPDGMLVGGHPGLFRSTDDGATFTRVTGDDQVPDVHGLGAAGNTAYLASPQAGLLASNDGGATWEPRNPRVGQSFMGTILVDPTDPQRLIAPDMSAGLVASADGGRTWTSLGGPGAAMAAAWDPTDTQRLLGVGMGGGAISTDGGKTWTEVRLPAGTSAAAFSADGLTLYAAALDGEAARTYVSTDTGKTWTQP